ncbi:MAG: N-acetylmannosamine-6-phosphate 2-epimerase [Lachnospiraceae bacterium]
MNTSLMALRSGLIVSCQALENEPLYLPQGGVMPLMAKAAMLGGAMGVRANSPRDIREIKIAIDLPVIGLYKKQYKGFEPYITPTMTEVKEIVEAGADIIAMDCTARPRPDGLRLEEAISQIKRLYPHVLLMADISSYEEGRAAEACGVDLVGTTLNGYTSYTESDCSREPNFDLVRRLSADCAAPIIAEGNIHYPWQAGRMLDMGAWSVVVGGAITRPMEITQRFVHEIALSHSPKNL